MEIDIDIDDIIGTSPSDCRVGGVLAASSPSTVFVRWYGTILQGVVVPDDRRVPLFAGMVHVRIVVQGTPVIAVFSPSNVYTTAPSSPSPKLPAISPAVAHTDTVLAASPAVQSQSTLDEHRARYRQFVASHWDTAHRHLSIDALEEFYQLFRQGVALKQQLSHTLTQPQKPKPSRQQPQQLTLNFQ